MASALPAAAVAARARVWHTYVLFSAFQYRWTISNHINRVNVQSKSHTILNHISRIVSGHKVLFNLLNIIWATVGGRGDAD
jgi:hypothetical protein